MHDTVKIAKTGGTEAIEKYGITEHYLESFGGWSKPEGKVEGLILTIGK